MKDTRLLSCASGDPRAQTVDQIIFCVPQFLGQGNVIEMRVHQSLDARVESIEISDAPRTHGVEIRRIADSTPIHKDRLVKDLDLFDFLGREPTPSRLVGRMAEND